MARINNLFSRLKDVTRIIKLKNFQLYEKVNKNSNKNLKKYEEIKNKNNNIEIENNENNNIIGINSINKDKNENNQNKIEEIKKEEEISQINIDEEIKININNQETNKLGRNRDKSFLQRKKRILKYEEKEDYDNVLSSIDYESYLKEQNEIKNHKKEQPNRETFCSGFFITSFNIQNPIIIEKSENFPAPCGHRQCSFLKCMQPEILMRYPLKDTEEVEINKMSTTLCFPCGIKICYCESDKRPEKMNDYSTLLTNRKGNKLYIMTYHFYLKMKKNEFDQNCEKSPLKLKLEELDEQMKSINLKNVNQVAIKFFEELKLSKEFEYRNYIYIPYCLALISKYPYIQQMKESIFCIFQIIENKIINNNLELNEILMYLIHSIPIPHLNTIIKFPLPYILDNKKENKNKNILTLEPPKFKDINLLNNNFCEILKIFRNKNIIRIFRLLLFEKKIIFIDNDYFRLSNVINSFLSLIYPFQWPHVYIPILTIPMMKYLETFLPFLVGVHSSFLPHIKKHLIKNSDDNNQVYLIFIEDDKIRLSDSLRGENKKLNKTRFLHEDLINLPIWMYLTLDHLLTNIKSKMKNIPKEDIIEFNFEIQNAFIEIFLEMFSDYNKYIYRIGDETIFNKNIFLSKKKLFEKKFYKEFLDTQMFIQFKQDILDEGYDYFKLKVSERNSEEKNKLIHTALEKTRTVVFDNQQEKTIYKINHQFKNMIKKEETINNNENYIIRYLNVENEKFDNSKCIIYLLPTLQTIETMVKDLNIIYLNSNNEIKKKRRLTEEERKRESHNYIIEDQIKEYILKIFKSDINKDEEDFKIINKILLNEPKGREFFIKLISKNLSKVVILPKYSFDVLYRLITQILSIFLLQLETSDDLYKHIVLLIKSTMNYGKEEKSKVVTIWDFCREKLNENGIIYDEKFWDGWYIFEINNNMNLSGIFLDNVKNEVMISISKIMKELGLDKTVIVLYTNNLIKKYFGKDLDLSQKTQKDILNILK